MPAAVVLLCGGLAAAAHADDGPVRMPGYVVRSDREEPDSAQPPQTVELVTAPRIQETVNVVDSEDAVKYLPSIFLRKRNYGDTQAVMATRVWGVSSSARSLVYADGILLSALIANNNNIGGPRWGLVAPAEIERIAVSYGPFSAAYPGNSMGAVMEIITRMPSKFEGSVSETLAWQTFKLYGTKTIFPTAQTAVTVGDRVDKFSFWVSADAQNSHSQPLSYVTSASFPTGTTGGYAALNKLGQPANILGATGLLHTEMANAKLKFAYDFTPGLRVAYTLGLWRNHADSGVETFLRDAAGQPTFAGQAGFASGYSTLRQEHFAHSVYLKSDTTSGWSFDAAASIYRMDRDEQRQPATASSVGTAFGSAGRVAVLGGTGWSTLDLKARWQAAPDGLHDLAFGVHEDRYKLYNPTFNTADWRGGPYGTVATEGDGKTRTRAIWAQDAWRFASSLRATIGLRYESWRAYDGYNVNGATAVRQPVVTADNFSPKASLAWTLSPGWNATLSVGKAYRYATAAELYQLVSTGTTFTAPDPHLRPDDVLATELKIERSWEHGRARLSLFQDDVRDAIIAQFAPLAPGSSTLFQFISNVDRVRARGVELAWEQIALPVDGLTLSGSVTYLDARTLATRGQGQFGSAIGRRLPNIPDWRATVVVSYRPSSRWSVTAAGRYSGRLYTTLDDADVNPNTYQGFSAWFVADFKLHVRLTTHWDASVGVDNVLDRKYFLFHPFPQRTWVADVKYAF